MNPLAIRNGGHVKACCTGKLLNNLGPSNNNCRLDSSSKHLRILLPFCRPVSRICRNEQRSESMQESSNFLGSPSRAGRPCLLPL
uniref:Uncharacterized protein n=1 Tax=Zea mays TaxID=4577 RepID=C0PMN0_MAIZE|nr:unknown [Zea mays]